MKRHQPTIRISPNAKTAVMFLHGIVGTPDHFEKFIPLVPESYSVYNLLWDGHGGTVEDFAKTSMKRWMNWYYILPLVFLRKTQTWKFIPFLIPDIIGYRIRMKNLY